MSIFVKRLVEYGFSEDQSKVLIDSSRDELNEHLDRLMEARVGIFSDSDTRDVCNEMLEREAWERYHQERASLEDRINTYRFNWLIDKAEELGISWPC